MSEWTVVKKYSDSDDVVLAIFTGGLSLMLDKLLGTRPKYVYVVEDEDGNQKKVVATDSVDLGEKIAEGDFLDIDD